MMYCGIYNKERGANLLLVPHSEGLRIALFVETSNDGSPTWMCKYMICHITPRAKKAHDGNKCMDTIHP